MYSAGCKGCLSFCGFPSSSFFAVDVLSNLFSHAMEISRQISRAISYLDTVEMHAALMSETCLSTLEAAHPTGCQWQQLQPQINELL